MTLPDSSPSVRASIPSRTQPKESLVFSPGVVLALAMWIYLVCLLTVVPIYSVQAHALAVAASLAASLPLEWLRSRGNKEYATAFLILLTLAPILYRYQHG